jgi:hypothetical protein
MNGFCKMGRKTGLLAQANTLKSQSELTLIDEINRLITQTRLRLRHQWLSRNGKGRFETRFEKIVHPLCFSAALSAARSTASMRSSLLYLRSS